MTKRKRKYDINDTKVMSIRLVNKDIELLNVFSNLTHLNKTEIIRRAIREYISRDCYIEERKKELLELEEQISKLIN